MCNIVHEIVEILFQDIPFSKKAEEIRSKVQKTLESKYAQSAEEDSMNTLKSIVDQSQSLYEVGNLAGYSKAEIDAIADRQDIKTRKHLKRLFKKYKVFAFTEALMLTFSLSSILNSICATMLVTFIFACLRFAIGTGLFFFFRKKKKIYAASQLADLKCDQEGRDYIRSCRDKYTKKEINMFFLLCAFLAYLVLTNLINFFVSAYTFTDILQQISHSSFILSVALFLLFKNIAARRLFSSFFTDESERDFIRHLKRIVILLAVYWLFGVVILFLLRNATSYIVNLFLCAFLINVCLWFLYNLILRKEWTFQNINFNPRRVAAISLIVVLLAGYQVMSMDLWLTQPYINTVSAAEREADQISYDDERGVYTITTNKQNFKILQLTDIHLGGSALSLTKDRKALKAVKKLIDAASPDFVVVTGDLVYPMGIMSYSLNNRAPVMQFASFMRNIGIPWAFTYGNHDTEAMSVITEDQFDKLMKDLSYRSSQNLLYPYIQPDIYGRNNQMIEVRQKDGTLMQALFLLDSNDYIEGGQLNEYDYIHDDQVQWYERQVGKLSKEAGYTVPSMIFIHIPLKEYREAYHLLGKGSDQVKYYYGEIGETMIDQICTSKHDSKLFDSVLKSGSTKAIFCGHDHYNNLSVAYKGVRLTYGYSIDYLAMPGIEYDTKQRGATLITIKRDGAFKIDPYPLTELK